MSATKSVHKRAHRKAIACLAAATALIVGAAGSASAQKYGVSSAASRTPVTTPGTPSRGGGSSGGGYRSPGWGAVVPGIITAVPSMLPPSNPRFIDDGTVVEDIDRPGRRQQRPQRASNAPTANERRLVPDEVVIEVASSVTPQQIEALQRHHRLTRIESRTMMLTGTTMFRWRIPDHRSVPAVVRALEADRVVASAQPNYVFTLQSDDAAKTSDELPQYERAKLKLPEAQTLATGENVRVAVIDSGIDASHPELAGSIAESFDALDKPMAPHAHGTGIAGLIAAHGKLKGAAPGARLLAIRAFDPDGKGAQGTTFSILKGLDWAAEHGARIINMSFAGPHDPGIARSLAAATKRNIVLVAAAGNAGAKSPPLYPGADPNVIAVTATDADDKLFEASNRGKYIAIAAPGAQIMVAIPDGGYEVSSGTSLSAAEVSGIAALMLQHNPDLTPAKLRSLLTMTAKDLGPKGRDDMFGAGLVDAYAALQAETPPVAQHVPLPVERVSTGR